MKMNIDLLYPIGSVYKSQVNVSPQNLFGGTWQSIPSTVGSMIDGVQSATNISGGSWQTVRTINLTPGTWVLCGNTNSANVGGWTARFAYNGSGLKEARQSAHSTDGNVYSTEHKTIFQTNTNVTVYLQIWSASARYVPNGELYAYRLDGLPAELYAWKRTA